MGFVADRLIAKCSAALCRRCRHAIPHLPSDPSANRFPPVNYEHIITIEPGKRGGKPCIRGLRITVYDVLDYLAGGMTEQEILADFPDLTAEDLKACLAFAADRERRLYRGNAA